MRSLFFVDVGSELQCSESNPGGDHECNWTHQYVVFASSPSAAAIAVRDKRKQLKCLEAPEYRVWMTREDDGPFDIDVEGGSSSDESNAELLYDLFADTSTMIKIVD